MNGRGIEGETRDGSDKRYPAPELKRKRDEVGEEWGIKSREDEGIEDRWKRRAELSVESPGRKTRHHRKIALSRTHLFSIPSSWPLPPYAPDRSHSSRSVPRVSIFSSACTSRFFHPTAIHNPFRRFPLFRWVTGADSLVARYAHSLDFL